MILKIGRGPGGTRSLQYGASLMFSTKTGACSPHPGYLLQRSSDKNASIPHAKKQKLF
jgi:hypothetical protein